MWHGGGRVESVRARHEEASCIVGDINVDLCGTISVKVSWESVRDTLTACVEGEEACLN